MDIWSADKLLLFIAFVVPGFISLKAYSLLCPGMRKKSADQLIDAITYSSVNYALLLWPIYAIETSGLQTESPTLYALFYVFVLLFAPIGWAVILKWLRSTDMFQASMPHPTENAWDYVFSQRGRRNWVIVTLKDGKRIGGRYDHMSFASTSPSTQLYLQETWVVNDDVGLERPRVNTAGVLILAADIETIEFFHYTRSDPDGQREAGQRAAGQAAAGQ